MQNFDVKTEEGDDAGNGYYAMGNGQQLDLSSGGTGDESFQDFAADDPIDDGGAESVPDQKPGSGDQFGGENDASRGSIGGDIDDNRAPGTEGGNEADHGHETSTLMKLKGKDDDKRKLFVGGLSWDTKEKDLKEYFSKFGEVEGLTYKTDAVTGRPRGFAFIIFTELSSVEQVLATGEHVINGKKVDPKRAKARPGKIFVGGLTSEITNDEVKEYFAKFGNVVDMEVPIDKLTNQRKNYCFVTFDDIAVSQELLKNPKQVIGGKEVDIKQAVPMAKPPHGGGGWHDSPVGMRGRGRGGGFRGRGGWGGGYGAPAYSSWAPGGYGVGGDGYGGYDYEGYYDGYESYGAGYDAYGRGRGRGGFPGKMRGGRGVYPRHAPY